MKRFAMILLAAASLVGVSGFASAQSHGGGGMHGGGGGGSWGGGGWHGGCGWYGSGVAIGIGPWGWGWGWPYYGGYYGAGYGYPGYGYPGYGYPYGADYSTQTYIQQDAPAYSEGQGQFSQGGPAYLYYCPDPAGYYPQVPSCSKGWMRVLPPGTPGPGAPAQP